MQVLDWGLCELQPREGSEAAVNRMKELCKLETYDLKFFLGNLFQFFRKTCNSHSVRGTHTRR
jgi:hypothetical protein